MRKGFSLAFLDQMKAVRDAIGTNISLNLKIVRIVLSDI
jgi:hypothetical protein